MKEDTLNKLYASFDEVKIKPGGGQYKYIKSRDIINRINRVFEGDWSSEVMGSEIVEDNVLICARVYVKDNGDTFYHDGYGSSAIARFSYGDNKGKAINIGNNYNAARSLAIKDAVKKWGVALYIEDEPDEDFVTDPSGELGPKLDVKRAVPTVPVTSVSKKGVTEFTPPPFPDSPTIDTVQTFPSTVEKTELTPPHGNITPVKGSVNVTQEVDIDKITDVQKVAIQGLLQLKGLEREKLFAAALGRTDNLPVSSEKLTYQEAVLIIKYGNDVDRK